MKRVVLDTNVFISALLAPQAEKGQILNHWMNGSFALLHSDTQVFEIRRVVIAIVWNVFWRKHEKCCPTGRTLRPTLRGVKPRVRGEACEYEQDSVS
jgi:predicted nucleic acid-binding protein